jgi:hypothetical protein
LYEINHTWLGIPPHNNFGVDHVNSFGYIYSNSTATPCTDPSQLSNSTTLAASACKTLVEGSACTHQAQILAPPVKKPARANAFAPSHEGAHGSGTPDVV